MLVCFYDMFFRQSAAASEEAAESEADAHGKEEQGLAEGGLSAIAMDSTSAAIFFNLMKRLLSFSRGSIFEFVRIY